MVALWMMPTSSPEALSALKLVPRGCCKGEGGALSTKEAEGEAAALAVPVAAGSGTGMTSALLLALLQTLLAPPLLALLPLMSLSAALTKGLFLSSRKYFTLKLSLLSRAFFALREVMEKHGHRGNIDMAGASKTYQWMLFVLGTIHTSLSLPRRSLLNRFFIVSA